MYSTATVILNPFAAGRRGLRSISTIEKELKRCIRSVELFRMRREQDAAGLAYDAVMNGSKLVIAIGGDGTANRVVNGLFEAKKSSGRDCLFGIIPAGTCCSLARELGIAPGLPSVRVLAEGMVRTIDLILLKWATPRGEWKERLAVTVANFGLGGAVVRSVGARSKRLGGFLAFAGAAARQLIRYESRRMTVDVDGKRIARSRLLCTIVANSQWEGGGMHVAPEARPDDGLLDVLVVEDLPVLSRLRCFPKVYTGKHVSLPMVRSAKARSVAIRSREALPFEYDGEWAECLWCSIEVLPKALSVLVPKQSAQRGA